MAATVKSSALNAFRRIVSELRKADKSFGTNSPQYKYLVDQLRDHHITQRVYSKAPEEAEHVANLYATYLSSTRNLRELEKRYGGRERSVEENLLKFLSQGMADDFADAGQRYTFLLRPVKDLGKNFEINIAKELDEYCERLGDVTEEAHGGVDSHHRFNFAEAAMLIQGTAYVFGKKVDYVHSQAIHFFEALQPQKTKKKKKKKGEEDEDEGFVEGEGNSVDPCDLVEYNKLKICNEKSLLRVCEKTKYKGHPPKIKVMPMSLMPLADNEKNGVLIYSTGYRMEIIGKMDDFKMNAGFLNSRGVLLLQLAHNKIVDEFASEAFIRMWHPYLFNPDGTLVPNPTGAHALVALQRVKSRCGQSQSQVPDSGRGSSIDELAKGDHGRISSAMEVARRATTNTLSDIHSARPSTRLLEAPEVETQEVKLVADGGAIESFDDGFDGGDFTLPVPVPCEPAPVPCEKRSARVQPHRVMPWETSENEPEEDCTEKLLLDPFEPSKWKTKPIEKIQRFVRGSTIAARMEKKEQAMTFQQRTMKTNDYVKEHFFMRKKVKPCKNDDWQTDALYRFIVAVMRKKAEAKRESRKAKSNPAAEGWPLQIPCLYMTRNSVSNSTFANFGIYGIV
ncbi:hypothetical protein GCK32_009542 [Trichostrongylus colubriformis]|uniref:Condensin II complex subunit H2 N-terminal domain-containing protein n=1 Tax=Trichostrongylus colubriformis TaxID=6319 RepID=A0AAN8IFU4_TRICO